MVWHLIKPLVHLLSQPFREAYDAFEMIEKGSQPTPPSTSECVARSESLFGFATGMLYVKERYGKEAKSEVFINMNHRRYRHHHHHHHHHLHHYHHHYHHNHNYYYHHHHIIIIITIIITITP
jgi:hypothetical protein